MIARRYLAGLLACLAFAACSDEPTSQGTLEQEPDLAVTGRPTLDGGLAIPVSLPVRDETGARGTFQGTITITEFALNASNQLVASGTIVGQTVIRGVTTTVNETFENLQVTPGRRCPILHLDIGPIFLDLLGLEVQTSRIVVDVTAVAGAGNLLGNLLCALVGLLDQTPLNLTLIQQLLNQINAILAAA